MSQDVNPKREYNSARRDEQARPTRAAILQSARDLFLERGYAATPLSAVATSADVSVETIYKAFTNKPGLVKALFDVAIVGDDEPAPLMERDFVRRNIAEPDPRKKLLDYGQHLGLIAPRAFPIQLIVRDAALTDSGAAEVWAQLQGERLHGMTMFSTHLRQGGHLRAGVSLNEARDVLWTHNSVEVWDLLVNQRGWTHRRYGQWVGRQLIAASL